MFKALGKSLKAAFDNERTAGPPTSSNGASSFHVHWELPNRKYVEASATIEVVKPPTVEALYFWALQVNFSKDSQKAAGAHFGLQNHPEFEQNGAVNWGGYHSSGGELDGSESLLGSATNNINTRDYVWQPGRAYRYRVFAIENVPDVWRGSITDLETGIETTIRDLYIEADAISGAMVWSEAFADCDAPSVAVHWSDFSLVDEAGDIIKPLSATLNYQTPEAGGCTNSNTSLEGATIIQTTNTQRINGTGARLTF